MHTRVWQLGGAREPWVLMRTPAPAQDRGAHLGAAASASGRHTSQREARRGEGSTRPPHVPLETTPPSFPAHHNARCCPSALPARRYFRRLDDFATARHEPGVVRHDDARRREARGVECRAQLYHPVDVVGLQKGPNRDEASERATSTPSICWRCAVDEYYTSERSNGAAATITEVT